MKRIVLFAPGAVPPWTEGRKIFVRDLAAALRSRGIDAQVLDGAPASSTATMILNALLGLRSAGNHAHAETVVVAFPFGTFHGLRGRINAWILRRSRSLCARAGFVHIPLFYSCVGLDVELLGRRYGPAVAVGRSAPGMSSIHLGIRHLADAWQPSGEGLKRLLFLCGYQKPTVRALHDVLYERGLIDLLSAGDAMATANIRLTIAVPFLRDAHMRSLLQAEIASRCPTLDVDFQGEVDPYSLFQSHDAFAFPYRSQHSVFVPTSLLEAMSFGIPVLAADHAMYRDLTGAASGPRCGLHEVANSMDVARTLLEMQKNYTFVVERARAVSIEVRDEWTVECAAGELLAAIGVVSA